jgi:pimeloyl-ACP methyl ester carboxylesterase
VDRARRGPEHPCLRLYRAGRGWSEPADTPQYATRIAADLHTLLQRGHVPGPYVLAGHSFGGLYTLTFAARYPKEVAGMVLVDSTDRASAATARTSSRYDGGSYDVLGRVSALISSTARLGLGRLFAQVGSGTLPPRSEGEVRASVATANNLRSTIDEYVQANASTQEAAALRNLADKPLIVLTAGIGSDAKHSAAQNELATLSTNTAHRIVDGADHEGLIGDKDGAANTTQAILDVIQAARSHTPLPQ